MLSFLWKFSLITLWHLRHCNCIIFTSYGSIQDNSHTWSSRKAWLLITIFAIHFPFLLSSFLGGKRKGETNNPSPCLSARSHTFQPFFCFTYSMYVLWLKSNSIKYVEKNLRWCIFWCESPHGMPHMPRYYY